MFLDKRWLCKNFCVKFNIFLFGISESQFKFKQIKYKFKRFVFGFSGIELKF